MAGVVERRAKRRNGGARAAGLAEAALIVAAHGDADLVQSGRDVGIAAAMLAETVDDERRAAPARPRGHGPIADEKLDAVLGLDQALTPRPWPPPAPRCGRRTGSRRGTCLPAR